MRPLLIGENNPVSLAKGHELYPLPEGCTGNRLWRMLSAAHERRHGKQLLPSRYLEGFERRNLVVARAFDKARAKISAGLMTQELFGSARHVVLLGRQVQRAFGVPPLDPLSEEVIGGCVFYVVPHPSGRNLWYNDPRNAAAVGELLLRLYEEVR